MILHILEKLKNVANNHPMPFLRGNILSFKFKFTRDYNLKDVLKTCIK